MITDSGGPLGLSGRRAGKGGMSEVYRAMVTTSVVRLNARLRASFPTAEATVSSYVMATTAKQDVRRVLDGLPEEASLEDIQYHLYVLQRIERGREDVEAGRVLPQDEVEQRLARWLDK